MNGLRLIARLAIQLVVASTNNPLRNDPSGTKLHNNVQIDATISSAPTPAQSIIIRCLRDVSRHAAVVSV